MSTGMVLMILYTSTTYRLPMGFPSLLPHVAGPGGEAPSSPSDHGVNPPVGLVFFDTGSWQILDVNGDGKADLVHLSPSDRTPGALSALEIHTLLSRGDGSWT